MTLKFARGAVLLVPVVLGWLTGCGATAASRFYMLSSTAGDLARDAAPRIAPDAVVALQVVDIPDYLDRPQIVSRLSPNRLHMAEYDRWAEPLDENVTAVIARNLRVLLGTDRVLVTPRIEDIPAEYGVRIDIVQLDGKPGESATLEARWDVVAGPERRLLTLKRTALAEPGLGSTYESLAEAESRLLAKLSEEIAQAIATGPR